MENVGVVSNRGHWWWLEVKLLTGTATPAALAFINHPKKRVLDVDARHGFLLERRLSGEHEGRKIRTAYKSHQTTPTIVQIQPPGYSFQQTIRTLQGHSSPSSP
uniref:Uncharacterized protein n=1 Tax=Mycena chlorophos TaxID=658473 RepID=A0ABQ0L0K9_MYCCL|nr:predicted protein [Mycena chlorophos]